MGILNDLKRENVFTGEFWNGKLGNGHWFKNKNVYVEDERERDEMKLLGGKQFQKILFLEIFSFLGLQSQPIFEVNESSELLLFGLDFI